MPSTGNGFIDFVLTAALIVLIVFLMVWAAKELGIHF